MCRTQNVYGMGIWTKTDRDWEQWRPSTVCVWGCVCATGELKNALYAVDPFKCVPVLDPSTAKTSMQALAQAFIDTTQVTRYDITNSCLSIVVPLPLSSSLSSQNTMYSVGALCRPDQFKNMEMKMRHSSRIRHRFELHHTPPSCDFFCFLFAAFRLHRVFECISSSSVPSYLILFGHGQEKRGKSRTR